MVELGGLVGTNLDLHAVPEALQTALSRQHFGSTKVLQLLTLQERLKNTAPLDASQHGPRLDMLLFYGIELPES